MRVEVHESKGFKLVRASGPIYAGERVMSLSTAVVLDQPTRTSIRIGPGRHVEDPVGACINHSCNPTCCVMGSDIVALTDLREGAEITFDYTQNEDDLASPFECGACGKLVTGSPAPCSQ